jgi:HD-like signal output (HDOD) protein
MQDKSLTGAIHNMIDADKLRLPVHPAIARQVLEKSAHLENPEQMKVLGARDPALACSLFRAANSSFFRGLNQTQTLDDAITRLGHEKTRQVLEHACQVDEGRSQGSLVPRYLPALWQHSVGCAIGSRWLANRCGYQGLAQQAYLAGLLHDVGKLFLLACLKEISSSEDLDMPLSDQIVHEVMRTMHVEQGLRLSGEWNLPEVFFQVINRHHETTLDNQDITLALVKLANKGCHKLGLGWEQDRSLVLPTTAEAQFLGISEIALAEYEIMLEDRFFSGESALLKNGEADETERIVNATT